MNDRVAGAGTDNSISSDHLAPMRARWRAANDLSVGQLRLLDNLLLGEPLTQPHVESRLLGRWGTP